MNRKNIILILIGLAGFSDGFISQLFLSSCSAPVSAIFFLILLSVLMFAWYREDSDQRYYPRSTWLNAGVIAWAVFAFPYYFFRSRGLWRGVVASLLFVLLVVVFLLLDAAGSFVAYTLLHH